MGGSRNIDSHVMGRILDAVLEANGHSAESVIQGRANVNWGVYTQYRDILLASNDITWSGGEARRVPTITSEGLETLRGLRRQAARWGKENLRVEAIRKESAAKRRARRPTLGQDSHEDSASDSGRGTSKPTSAIKPDDDRHT